jgi:hypothetical protein
MHKTIVRMIAFQERGVHIERIQDIDWHLLCFQSLYYMRSAYAEPLRHRELINIWTNHVDFHAASPPLAYLPIHHSREGI